jgi:hypothetical protein
MSDYRLYVPADCVASNSVEETEYSLRQMKHILKADISPSSAIDLGALKDQRNDDNEPIVGEFITVE